MVKRIRRKRSAKHTDKEEEEVQMKETEAVELESTFNQHKFASPIRIYIPEEKLEMLDDWNVIIHEFCCQFKLKVISISLNL